MTAEKCTGKVGCMFNVVVLRTKPVAFFTFSLPLPSLDLKVPDLFFRALTGPA